MRTSNTEHRTLNIKVKGRRTLPSLGRSLLDVRRSMFAWMLIPLLITGCSRLSPGPIQSTPSPALPRICLVRGYLDWYSTGMDTLRDELKADGSPAQAYREEQWGALADELKLHPHQPLVLIGFSYGADDVILMARRLKEAKLHVDLLITIDPVTPASIPDNVTQCVNFYEPNGFWDIFPWLRGIPVQADPPAVAKNINIRQTQGLMERDTSHANIASNEKVHRAIRELVQRLVSPKHS